jgi:hypothetical protein
MEIIREAEAHAVIGASFEVYQAGGLRRALPKFFLSGASISFSASHASARSESRGSSSAPRLVCSAKNVRQVLPSQEGGC